MDEFTVNRPASMPEDRAGHALRPERLDQFIGQRDVCENLRVFVEAAQGRTEAMDHILLFGPPGLGKTTLARIIARELGVGFRPTSGPVLARAGDLAALLSAVEPRDVLFIDEIHRLHPAVEEVLYPAMEDYKLDLMIGQGPGARSVRIDLPPFTLIAATTRPGMITNPLYGRFGIPLHLDFYSHDDLARIIIRAAGLLDTVISADGAMAIARRSRGTPRVAGRLLRRVRDFTTTHGATTIEAEAAGHALTRLDIDSVGLGKLDRHYLTALAELYQGGPTGIETLAAALSSERDVLEELIEPFLMQIGMVERTPRGRKLTRAGWQHIGLAPPPGDRDPQLSLT
ncbi:MAG: Holliday junction branch migration DNA helicase RuvB [Pseudomonadota bacterium]